MPPSSGRTQTAAHPYAARYVLPAASPRSVGQLVPRSSMLGLVALFAALAALVAAPIAGAVAAFNVGLGAGQEIAPAPPAAGFDWSFLSPVRDWVLLGEIAFWGGTALGIWALVQGIIAIVKLAGRGQGIAAVVIAALGAVAFGVAVQIALVAGIAAGSSIGG